MTLTNIMIVVLVIVFLVGIIRTYIVKNNGGDYIRVILNTIRIVTFINLLISICFFD